MKPTIEGLLILALSVACVILAMGGGVVIDNTKRRLKLMSQATHVDECLRLCKFVNGKLFKYKDFKFIGSNRYPVWTDCNSHSRDGIVEV